jgi:hypothetical protein
LYFENVSGDENVLGKILRIDTAYYGNANNGDGTLKFQWGDTLSAISAVTNTTAQTIYKYSDEAAYNAEIYGSNYRNYPSVGVSGYRVNIDGFYNRTMAAVSDFINHYRFQATYFWAEDSLAIDVAQANLRPQISSLPPFYLAHDYIKLWEQPYYEWAIIEDKNDTGTSAAGAASLNFTSNTQATEEYKKNLLTGASLNRTDGDLLHVRLNSFDGGSRGLTVGDRPLAVKPQFKDFPNCTPDNPSLPEGVYIIRNNTLDKLLTVPIYSDTTAQWVTKKETVDPTRLPSYQWIAKLVNKSNPETSPITFINREFPTVRLENVRLPHDGETITLASQYELVNNQSSFERITDEKILKNKYLGYFHATGDPIETYDLNYLDQNAGINLSKENAGLFLNKGDKSTDSTLLVSTGRKLQFRIVPVAGAPTTDGKSRKAEHMYGYYVEGSDVQKEGVQLYRTAYQLLTDVIEDGKPVTKTLFINGEHRYALNNWVGGYYNSSLTNPGYNQGTFLLKTNNSATPFAKKDKEDFYALLDTTSISEYLQKTPNYGSSKNFSATDGTRGGNPKSSDAAERNLAGQPYDLRYVKLDIPEDAPWAYENDQTDRTTSAFAITRYNAPLYRRFDKQDYEYNNQEDPTLKIDEKFGDISESPLILKFHNSTRLADHLYENSPKSDLIGKSIFRDGLSPYGQAHTSFLGIYNTFEANELLKAEKDGDHVINYNFYVDTAFVRRETGTVGTPSKPATWDNYTNMPQYMLVVNPDTAGPAELKYQSGFYVWPEGAIAESGVWDKEANPYEEIKSINVPGLTVGDYLYNAQDSVNIGKNDFKGQIGSSIENATRLAFIRGAHLDDTFYVLAGTKYANYNAKQLQVLQGLTGVLYHDLSWYNKIYLGKNDHYTPRFDANWTAKAYADTIAKHKAQVGKALPDYLSTKSRNGKSMVFQFRLKNVAGMANELREFYIESQVSVGPEIGPASASFIHSFNGGAPVIAFSSFAAGRDYTNAALGLQVEAPTVDSVKQVTANEAAQISDAARVISGVNQISILNAAGKTVTVTNVLGQTVAKTVATSDNATITLPKGIVVVSVDGKSTKAVVK